VQTLCWTSGQALAPCMPVVGLLGRHAVAASAGKTRTSVATAEGDMYTWETTGVMYNMHKEAGTPCSPNDRLGSAPFTVVSPSPLERVLSSSQTGAGVWPASPPSSRSVGHLAALHPSQGARVVRVRIRHFGYSHASRLLAVRPPTDPDDSHGCGCGAQH